MSEPIREHFACWDDLIHEAETRGSDFSKRASRLSDHFYGEQDWNTALAFAKLGWPTGREQIAEGINVAHATGMTVYRSQVMDVAGAYPCIPTALAGDPCCMVDLGDQLIASNPVVRIRCDIAVPALVDNSAIINNGVAILSCVDALERAGYSTEIGLRWQTCSDGDDRQNTIVLILDAVFKRAGEPLDLDRAAFALAHPSTLRRLGFSILESRPECKCLEVGYGKPAPLLPEAGVVIAPPADNQNCKTLASALKRVQSAFAQQGYDIGWMEEQR